MELETGSNEAILKNLWKTYTGRGEDPRWGKLCLKELF